MSAATTRKLTKKQKKGLAFRERKGKKEVAEEELAVPEADAVEAEPTASKKRKRESGENTEGQKKRKTEDGAAPVAVTAGKKAERYILFVGNLKYTTPAETIRDHFSKCDPPPQVRLLTPKMPVAKSKGCAFLEFSHKNALQQGLKLHGSSLDGRQINVELTAGGGGKSEQRVQKVRARNKQLLEERKTRAEKKGDMDVMARPQRHSTTSGLENVPLDKRTWAVPEAEEQRGRGGAKNRGKKKPAKNWGTGANSIAVG